MTSIADLIPIFLPDALGSDHCVGMGGSLVVDVGAPGSAAPPFPQGRQALG